MGFTGMFGPPCPFCGGEDAVWVYLLLETVKSGLAGVGSTGGTVGCSCP